MSSKSIVFNAKIYQTIVNSDVIIHEFAALDFFQATGIDQSRMPKFKEFLSSLAELFYDDADVTDLAIVGAICKKVAAAPGYAEFYRECINGEAKLPKAERHLADDCADVPRVTKKGKSGKNERKEMIKKVLHTSEFPDYEDLEQHDDSESSEEVSSDEERDEDQERLELIDDLDDFDAPITVNLNDFHKKLGSAFAVYTVDEVARTIIKICRDKGMSIVRNFKVSGKTITDHKLQYLLSSKIRDDESYARSAMSQLTVSVNVTRCDIQPDTFFSKQCSIVSQTPFIVHNGEYYGYFDGGAFIQFSRKPIRDYTPDREYSELWASCSMLYTTTELRLTFQLPFWSKKNATITQRIWTISDEVSRRLPAHHKNLWNVVKRAADVLKNGKLGVIGWVDVRTPGQTKNVRKSMTLMAFIKACMVTLADPEVDFNFDRNTWRDLRKDTLLDQAWHKHEYKTLKLGETVVPYNNTSIKFVDAYLNLVRGDKSWLKCGKFAKPTNKVAILYGGVTSSGRNTQLLAVRHFFRELWGKSIAESHGSGKAAARWNIFNFDLHGNAYTDTIQIDASKREDVARLNELTGEYDVVICILDLADGSVNSSLNVKLENWLPNFLVLEKLEFVTTKYCCTSKISVAGADRIIPMNSVIFGTKDAPINVGRTHGAEGICLLTPSKKTVRGPAICLMPMSFDKDGAFRMKCFEGSLQQFSPHATLDVPSEFVRWFPKSASMTAGFRGGQDVEIEIVRKWSDAGAFEHIEDTSDEDQSVRVSGASTAADEAPNASRPK